MSFTKSKAERIKKYVEVAKMCHWKPPKDNKYTEAMVIDAAIAKALHDDVQVNAIYIVIGWIPLLYSYFKTQMKDYITRYGTESELEELLKLKVKI